MAKVLVTDSISARGIRILEQSHEVDVKTGLCPEDLKKIVSDYEGLVVRSETKVTEEIIAAANKLRVIARAGIGVDNIDVSAATNAGIASTTLLTYLPGNLELSTMAGGEIATKTKEYVMDKTKDIGNTEATQRYGQLDDYLRKNK